MNAVERELEMRRLPKLMLFQDGGPVKTAEDWRQRREEIKELLCRECFGFPTRLSYEVTGQVVHTQEDAYGGKAVRQTVELEIRSAFSHASFPFTVTLPKDQERPPLFLCLSFTPSEADGLGEEILDGGFGLASVYYQDMTADYYDSHMSGLGRFCTRNQFDSWGKIAMWAWGASRMLDWILEHTGADPKRIAVIGHSRLGKTALLAGGMDERFSLTVSNDSGGGGAALFRQKTGERICDLYGKGSRLWFAGNFFRYCGREEELPFDQHFLLALTAPRHLYIASASRDDWADPVSEFLSCAAVSEVYETLGLPGLVYPGRFPKEGDCFHEGRVGCHLRKGTHYLSRWDWQRVMEYRRLHQV